MQNNNRTNTDKQA